MTPDPRAAETTWQPSALSTRPAEDDPPTREIPAIRTASAPLAPPPTPAESPSATAPTPAPDDIGAAEPGPPAVPDADLRSGWWPADRRGTCAAWVADLDDSWVTPAPST